MVIIVTASLSAAQFYSDLGAIGTLVSASASTEVTTSGLNNETICKITLQPGKYIILASSYIPAKCRYFAQINGCHSSADDTVGYTGAEVISIGKFTSQVTLDYKLWLMNVSKECTISSKVVAIRIK